MDEGPQYAIIGGTGFSDFAPGEAREVATPYGPAQVIEVEVGGEPVIFLPRHGAGHSALPHRINYRANIWALRRLGVRRIVAASTVGSMNEKMQPGECAVLTQFLDFTRSRASTFFDEAGSPAMHVDVSDPYCPSLRAALMRAGENLGTALHPSCTYVCTEGPRFETPAEIEAFRSLGGDVVGMTGVPEVTLAREANRCYAAIAVVTNWAAGIAGRPLSHQEVLAAMGEELERVWRLLAEAVLPHRLSPASCSCAEAVDEAVWEGDRA